MVGASNSIIVSRVHCTTTETTIRLLVNREHEEKVIYNSLLAPNLSNSVKSVISVSTVTVYSAVLPSSQRVFYRRGGCMPVE